MANEKGARRGSAQTATPGEWLCAAIGAAMTLGTIGFLSYEGFSEPDGAVPRLAVAVDSVASQPSGYLVGFTARNDGEATAAAVRVVGELRRGGEVVQTSEVTLDYVPEASERAGGLIFSLDPADHTLDLRATGYARP